MSLRTARRIRLRRDAGALTSWRAYVRNNVRSPRPLDGLVEYHGPTELWIPERPRFLYYFTKDSMFRWWFRAFAGDLPRDIGVIAHGSTPSPRTSLRILRLAKSTGVPLVVLGDLDPGDLTAFAALVSGGIALGRPPRIQVSVLYGGIDDVLIRSIRRRVGSRRFESDCMLRMSADERDHLTRLSTVYPSLPALLGRASARYLKAGLKCEVEALFSPHVCRGVLLAEVRRHLSAHLPASLGL